MNSQLPTSWISTSLGELFEIVGGGTPSTVVDEYWKGNIPWITSADIDEGHHITFRRYISESAVDSSATTRVPPGSVIVVTRVGLGKVAVAPTELCFSQDCQALLISPDSFDPAYIVYYMEGAAKEFRHIGRGTTISGITKKQLKVVEIPVPPRQEQRRMVEALEELFTRLDAGVAALKRMQANLKRYRAAVLKAACEGRLVPTEAELARREGCSYETGEQLLARILEQRRAKWEANHVAKILAAAKPPQDDSWKKKYKEPTLPDIGSEARALPVGWTWTTIGAVSQCLDGQRVPVNKDERALRGGNIPYYGANGRVGWIDEYLFDEPLVLVVEDETFVGRTTPFCYLIRGKSWVNNHAHVLRPTGTVLPEYLNYSLAFYPFTPLTTGSTGRRKLTQKALMSARYALPPLAEQKRIVEEVERLLSVAEAIAATVAVTEARGEVLRQSILKCAFEGKLVPQDPYDEPASVLLERIRAERQSQAAVNERPVRRRGTRKKAQAVGAK